MEETSLEVCMVVGGVFSGRVIGAVERREQGVRVQVEMIKRS